MKFKFFPIFVLLLFSSRVLAQEPTLIEPLRMMKTVGFWISRHPSPDAVIMSPEQIERFNVKTAHKDRDY